MANRRMIASDLFEDDFIGALSFFDRLLWIGIIAAVADDQGRLMDKPALIRSRVFLYDDDVKDSTVQASLDRLAVAHKIACYVAGGKQLIQIVNWWKYQTPAWASPSKYPAPAGWMDRVKYHTTGNKIVMLNWDKHGGYVADYVAPLDRALNEGDVKGDDDVKGEGEECALTSCEVVQHYIERLTGIMPSTPGDSKALDEFVKAELIGADITSGYQWFVDQGKTFQYYSSLVGPSKTAKSKRMNGYGSRAAGYSEEF